MKNELRRKPMGRYLTLDPDELPAEAAFLNRLNGRMAVLSTLLNDNEATYKCDLDGVLALGALFSGMAHSAGFDEEKFLAIAREFYLKTQPKAKVN